MGDQTKNQVVGTLNEEITFVVSPFPWNLGQDQLERAVERYRQAVGQKGQSSKSVEVTNNGR